MKKGLVVAIFFLGICVGWTQESRRDEEAVKEKYDAFSGVTQFSAGPFALPDAPREGPRAHEVRIEGFVSCKGKVAACPGEPLVILVTAHSPFWWFADVREADFLIDGEALSGGKYKWRGSVLQGEVFETMTFPIAARELEKVTGGWDVQLRLGIQVLTLTPESLRGLRSLGKRIPIPKQEGKKDAPKT